MVHQRTQPGHILLVENNEGDELIAREALETGQTPVIVHHVSDGEAALAFLRCEGAYFDAPKPHFILLAIGLPKINGLDVLNEIKKDPALKRIPVIMLTPAYRPSDTLEAYRHLANGYVVKPTDTKTYAELVRRIESFWLDLAVLPDGSTGSGLG